MGSRIGSYVRKHHLALLCLFLIIGGGTAWALERNSVRSKHIVNGQVRDADLSAGIPSGVKVVDNTSVTNSADKSGDVECPDGKVAIGGGALAPTSGATGFVALTQSNPATIDSGSDFEGWHAAAIEVNGGSTQVWGIRLFAICARP